MPKIKTHRGAAKRFRVTAGGKLKRGRAYKRHILTSKPAGRKRRLAKSDMISKADTARVRRMLPYEA